jgi:hypothetical protein
VRHHAERGSRLTKGGRISVVTEFDAIRSEGSKRPLASTPPAAPLPRRSEAEAFWNSFSCDRSIAMLQSVPAFLLQTPGGGPAAPAQVAQCRMLPLRMWKRGPVDYGSVPVFRIGAPQHSCSVLKKRIGFPAVRVLISGNWIDQSTQRFFA